MGPERLNDLLTQRATQGLTETEERELHELLRHQPEVDEDAFDRAAAAVHLVALRTEEHLPAALRRAIEQDAARYFSNREKG